MRVRKGEKLTVHDSRKGTYNAVAIKAFDTIKDEWFPVAVDQDEAVVGASNGAYWFKGSEIPARKGLSRITKRRTRR